MDFFVDITDYMMTNLSNYGVWGLALISFIESTFSPILPDLLLIPMAVAQPEQAIYYSLVATGTSVLGGVLGYGIGAKFGYSAMNRFVPEHHLARMEPWMVKYGAWALFIAVMSPIPYKFVAIIAGALRMKMSLFLIFSVFGRAKRFLLEGILIFYYGPQAISFIQKLFGISLMK